MIKLIGMDLDWTIIDYTPGAKMIGKELIEELNGFIEKGNYAGIVSGRPLWGFHDSFVICGSQWGMTFPNFVVSREAYIYDVKNGDYIDVKDYNQPVREKIMNFNRKFAAQVNDVLTMYKDNCIKVNDFIVYGDFATEIMVEKDKADKAMELMNKFLKEKNLNDALVHRNCNSITVYNKGAGKGKTLLGVAKHFGLEPSEILAIGDNYNDISMIDGRYGFIGACVGNADDNIKNIVRQGGGFVGNGTAHNGITDIIRQVKEKGLMK